MTTQILALRKEGSLFAAKPEDLPSLLAEPDVVVWVDFVDPKDAERRILEDYFKLHALTVEDMLSDAPTPKVERFEGYLYLVFHGLLKGAEKSGEVATCDLDMFLGKNWLITSHGGDLDACKLVHETLRTKLELMRRGPAHVAYLIIEHVTERYLPLMERLDHDIDTIETSIVKSQGPHILEKIFEIKHKLQRLRRIGLHQREVLNRLGRGDFDIIPADERPFFRDAYDHFVRVVDLNDSFREIVSGSLDAYISMQGHRMNEIMKVLTLISTIMLPLTFIAGVYGMNFEVMPELHWQYGYFAAIGSMLLTGVVFFIYFRRRGWV
ncbi:MAG: magnesium/cobalt transporter CorA [Deltaproteobacteria bacterium]|nr:magnesium/cobalt transporter CorA [Deltaproteobacteria bacterium]